VHKTVGAGVSILSSLCGFMLWLEQAPVKLEGPRTWFPAFPKAWPERELRRGPGLAGCGRAQGGFASRPQQ